MGELTKTEKTELMNCLLDMGQLLLESGAEISRVEDTLSRMAKAYGCTHIEVFAITSIISLSVEFPGEDVFTETRRIYFSSGTDFTRLENLNRISRSCCKNPLPVPELQKSLHQVVSEEKHFETVLLGSILAAGGFTVFFGGSLWDGLAACVFAIGICLLQRKLGETQITPVGTNLLMAHRRFCLHCDSCPAYGQNPDRRYYAFDPGTCHHKRCAQYAGRQHDFRPCPADGKPDLGNGTRWRFYDCYNDC